jgi:hypothetical protein
MARRRGKNVISTFKLCLAFSLLFGLSFLEADSRHLVFVMPEKAVYKEDFNGDGSVNALDVIYLAMMCIHNPADTLCDYNKDGVSNILDAVQLLVNIKSGHLIPIIPEVPPDTTKPDTTKPDTTKPDSTIKTYSISGYVFCANGLVTGAKIMLISAEGITLVTTQSEEGYYSFQVPSGSYMIEPVQVAGYVFSPPLFNLIVKSDMQFINFFVYGIESLPLG